MVGNGGVGAWELADVAHGPYIVSGNSRYAVESAIARVGHNRPRRTVPVLGQFLLEGAGGGVIAHRPDIVRRHRRYAVQTLVAARARVRARHDVPSNPAALRRRGGRSKLP